MSKKSKVRLATAIFQLRLDTFSPAEYTSRIHPIIITIYASSIRLLNLAVAFAKEASLRPTIKTLLLDDLAAVATTFDVSKQGQIEVAKKVAEALTILGPKNAVAIGALDAMVQKIRNSGGEVPEIFQFARLCRDGNPPPADEAREEKIKLRFRDILKNFRRLNPPDLVELDGPHRQLAIIAATIALQNAEVDERQVELENIIADYDRAFAKEVINQLIKAGGADMRIELMKIPACKNLYAKISNSKIFISLNNGPSLTYPQT